MFRGLLIFCLSLFGTCTYAQSVEERLTECIAQSQRVVKYAIAWRTSLENIGESARPREFAEIITSYAYEELLKGTVESLKSNDDPLKIVKDIEQASNPILIRTELIEGMVDEAFTEQNRFEAMAEYISACTNNFGGDTYTLQDKIRILEEQLVKAEEEKRTSDVKFKADLRSELDPYKKRVDTHCTWMRT